jgi:hypothetical protein
VEHRRLRVGKQVRLPKRLTAALKSYYPQLSDAVGKSGSRMMK